MFKSFLALRRISSRCSASFLYNDGGQILVACLPCTTGAIAGIVNHARHVRRNNKVREPVFPGMFGYKDGIAVFPSAALLELDSLQRGDLTRSK